MAGFNINDFQAQGLALGGARPTQFIVRIAAPPPGIGASATQQLQFLAHSASLPASTINQIDIPYFGRKIPIAGDRVYDNWTINIMNDEDFNLRAMFEAWHSKMNTAISNRLDPSFFPLGYKVQAEVLQFGKTGPGTDAGAVRSYLFNGLFPINISQIDLDWAQTNQVETFNVTFAYDEWVPNIQGSASDVYSPTLNPA